MDTPAVKSAVKPTVTIYTDGGADPNPGPGGWGALLLFDKDGTIHERELSGGEPDTTNNRMELTAAMNALRALKQPCVVELYTDSQYLKRGIEQWFAKWIQTNFKGGKIQNVDLWQPLKAEIDRHEIHWHWVKGHAGNVYNERVDQLATAAMPRVAAAPSDPNATRAYLRTSCSGAPGVGGFAVLLEKGETTKVVTGGHPKTNAQRMDLMAAIAALEAIPEGGQIEVYTPNSYLHDGITQWISGWKRAGWIKKTGGEVAYRDLWERLDNLAQTRNVRWMLIKGEAKPAEFERLEKPLKDAVEAARHLPSSSGAKN